MAKFHQFGLLLWKNFIIQRRKVLVTILEIGLPCLFAFLLVAIRQDVQNTQQPNATVWPAFSANEILNNLTKKTPAPWKLAWTPSNSLTNGIVKTVANRLKLDYQGLGFPDEDSMVNFLTASNGTMNGVLGGIVFSSLDPGKLSYKIRLPSRSRGARKQSFMGDQSWKTMFKFPLLEIVGPRAKQSTSGGAPGYWQQGFLALQEAVDRALLEHLAPSFSQSSVEIELRRHPYPPYEDDMFVLVLQKQLPLIIMLSFIFLAQNVVRSVLLEKERKLKESMKMMGLANYLHWAAWFVHSLLMCTLTIIIMTLLFCVQFGGQGRVIGRTDPSIIFVYLMAYAISVIAFSFAISTIFSKANTGAAAGGIIFFVSFIPFSIIEPRYHKLSLAAKLACSLINNVAMAQGGLVIGMFEGTGAGVQWSTIAQGASVDDDLSVLAVIIMLLVDSLLYMIFTWYVEAVFPGDYGVAQPWYFPIKREYWLGPGPSRVVEVESGSGSANYQSLHLNDMSETDEYFEKFPVGIQPGISIKNLRKVFKTGHRRLVAVKGMNMNFYEGQISALLGHNGAGKSTTMAMLTGFIPPSGGTAVVNGHDIRTDIEGARQSLGLCPQHDVLFDQLTVREHLQFFCKLKGYPSHLMKEEVDRMMKAVDLYEKRNVYTKELSGGMKRKLSVAIALVADSKVVILDEPTSGMDPNARRQIWELLQKERAARTMVLTTHYMDEADHLGDRIAIMAEGVLKCYGTSLFLKQKYGAGYHMVLVKNDNCSVDDVTEVVQKHVEAASLESNIGMDLSYILPHEESGNFEWMFTELEERKDELGIMSYGVSVTTMEEVFLRVGASADPDLDCRLRAGTGGGGASSAGSQAGDDNSLTESQAGYVTIPERESRFMTSPHQFSVLVEGQGQGQGQSQTKDPDVYPKPDDFNKGILLYLQQLRALFYKRVLYTWRNRIVTLSQLAVPLFFTIAALAIVKTMPEPGNSPPFVLNISAYQENVVAFSTGDTPNKQIEKLARVYQQQFSEYPGTDVIDIDNPQLTSNLDMENYLIEKGSESVSRYSNRYLLAAVFENQVQNPDQSKVTAYFNNQAYHTPAITLNAITNALLRMFTMATATMTTVNHPLPRTAQEEVNDEMEEIMLGFTISFNVMTGMAFLSSSFILYLIRERSSKSKHCQFVSGARASAFWLATFLWDFINYMIPCILLFVVFAAFNIEAYTGDDRLGLLLLVFILFGWAMLPFMYLFSFLFTVPATGFVWMTMFNIFSGIATVLAVQILSIPQLKLEHLSRLLEWIFLSILPNFCFGQALEAFYTNYEYIRLCTAPEVQEVCKMAPFIQNFTFPCCKGNCAPDCIYYEENYLSWEQGGIGRMVVFMLCQGIVFFTILFLIESEIVHRFRFWLMGGGRCWRGSKTGHKETEEENSLVVEDSDVALERTRIQSNVHEDPLVLNEVVKYYDNLLAVNRLSLGISHGECFGLLGINGAGKTTTFKILTGDEPLSSGKAYVCGYNVQKDSDKVRRRIGYCPQYDALVDHMTGRELLTLYARLRGVKQYMINDLVNHLLYSLTLDSHADKFTSHYSGGNKRKLSTALALVGEPYIVFLDEPSSGMDPVARRLMWDALSRYRKRGKTLVLTSHSMEECEALCTRMGIMVNGQFRCLGSQQHLKTKFGEGYTLMVRVGYTQNQEPDVKPLMEYINLQFPDCELKDLHQNLLHYHIPAQNVSWAQIFGKVEKVKEKLRIEDYSVSQTTLEQVFINFARGQMTSQKTKLGCCSRVFCCSCCKRQTESE